MVVVVWWWCCGGGGSESGGGSMVLGDVGGEWRYKAQALLESGAMVAWR